MVISLLKSKLTWKWFFVNSVKNIFNVQSSFLFFARSYSFLTSSMVLWQIVFKNLSQPRPHLSITFVFSNKNTIFTANKCEKMSIQYTMLGFEPTTFGTWVSSQNHNIRAPAPCGRLSSRSFNPLRKVRF